MGYINSQIGGTSQTISEKKVGPPGPGGPPGPEGPPGPKGDKGPAGPQGQKGDKGDKGEKGDSGPQGQKGAQGAHGPHGPQGPHGAEGPQGPQGPQGIRGPKGDTGPQGSVGSADIDMQNKYDILRLKSNPYPIHGDLTKVINYQDTRNIFLSKKEGGKMEASINMNDNTIFNVKDPVQTDQATNKKYVDYQLVKKLDKDVDIDMKNNSIINLKFPSNQKDATSIEFVNKRLNETQKIYLKFDGSNSMTGELNLNNKIINLHTDGKDLKSAVNVDFMENEITSLTKLVSQSIHESHITSSGQTKDAFRYLMEDTDESSSENNINVLGINYFPESPHQINKKAYTLKLLFEKDSPNQYRSRLGFNLYKLPVSYYTMVVEWFPAEMNELSVTPEATTISISNYTTKTFEKYTKTVIHFHRWGSSPPQYIYLDLHGTVRNPSLITLGHQIVYGVKETIPNVDPSVYDSAFVIENGKMVMETDLSLNGHNLSGSVHRINGFVDTKQGFRFLLNGYDEIIMNQNNLKNKIKLIYSSQKRNYTPISLQIKHTTPTSSHVGKIFQSTETTKTQTININIMFPYCCTMLTDLNSPAKDEKILMLLEYI